VRDSKLLSPRRREQLAGEIMTVAAACATGLASAAEIDRLGIAPATRLAMQRTLAALPLAPEGLLIDWVRLPDVPLPQIARPKADRDMVSVAAASILAKVTRDRRMVAMEDEYPGYGFAAHKGYGAPRHLQALRTLGGCPEHRRTFAPLAGQLALFAASERTEEQAHGG
jgi:ribonuclease HII